MTVPVSDRLSQLYVGNGLNQRFDFTFRVFNQEAESGIVVRQKTAVEFVTLDPSLYTVTLNQDNLGGHINFITPPESNVYFYIAGATSLDQLLDITNYDNFYPDAIERALDKLTALLQEWGTKIDQEKQERILADIKYDSLAMEREANLENRLISYINAVVGITNPKIFDGITDRMVITKDGRNQREFNESIPFWTNDYVSFKQETYFREEKILDHVNSENSRLDAKISSETGRALSAEQLLQIQINANGVGNRAYKQLSDADADKANIPPKSKVTVTNDATSSNDGDWQWDGVTFTKSAYDPITQSNAYSDSKIDGLMTAAQIPLSQLSAITSGFISSSGVEQSSTNWSKSGFIKVNIKDKVTYNATGNSTIAFIAAYDTNKTFLRDLRPISGSTLTNVSGELAIPSDVKYIRVSFYSANSTAYSFTLTPYKIGVSGLDMPNISSVVFADIQGSANLFDSTKATDNAFLSNNVIGASTSWFVSDYISVVAGESYVTNGASTGSATSGVHYYDASKNFISYGSRQIANTAFTVPSGVSFIRLNYTKSASSSLKDTIVAAGAAIAPDLLKLKIDDALSDINFTNRYLGKTLMTLGDSITDSTSTAFTYPPIVAAHFEMSLFDGGWSGRRIRNAFGRTTIASDTNILESHIITIAHGTNDFKLETSLGTIDDSPTPKATLDNATYNATTNLTDGTFYADYKGVIEHILTVNPQARIMLITPIRRTQPAATGTDTNAKGFKLVDYVNAIKSVAELYGLPVLDNYNTSGFNLKTMPTWTSDGLHPTAWAQENVMAQKVIGFINSN